MNKIIQFFSLLLVSLLLAIHPLMAQEKQVYMDQDGKILSIDQKMERKLSLFPATTNFEIARLFQVDQNAYILEVNYRMNGLQQRDKIEMDATEVAEFRQNLSNSLAEKAPRAGRDARGGTRLLINASIVTVGYYGWAVPVSMDVQNEKGAIGLYMLTSAAGFFTPFLLTQNSDVSLGSANLYSYGATRGIAHGLLLGHATRSKDDYDYGRRSLGLGIALSIGEGIAGYHIAKANGWSKGKSATVGTYGDAGSLALPLALIAANPDGDNDRLLAASSLIGAAGGLLLGSKVSSIQNYSKGDAQVLRISGLIGAGIPLAVMATMEVESDGAYAGAALIGGAAGLAMGHFATKKVDYRHGQGVIIALGTIASSAFGAGVGYLVSGEGENSWKVPVIGSAIGAAGGYAILNSSLSKTAQLASDNDISLNVQLAPEGIAAVMGKTPVPTGNTFLQETPPLVRASIRF